MEIRKRIFRSVLVISLLLFGFITFSLINALPRYLSITKKVSANLLLVEGWLPPYAIEMAADEFRNCNYDLIITTGLKSSDYYMMAMNGYLIFYIKGKIPDNKTDPAHVIEVDAYSELEGENSSHFNLFINDSLIADFYTHKHKKKYSIVWQDDLSKIDSITVNFDNDKHGDFGDRNLFIKEIIIDHTVKIPYQNNSEYDIGTLDRRYRINNNFDSYAELARKRFLVLGIDSSLIVAIPGKRAKINRTLSSTLAVRDWIETSNIEITGINIVSLGVHARRSLMTYQKVLDKSYAIGVISLPDFKYQHSLRNKIFKIIHETVGIIYYWVILNFC